MMPERLKKIVDGLNFDPQDIEQFGRRVIYFLQNESFWNETDNYSFLRKYITDVLAFNKIDITFKKKYSGTIYHENTYKSLEFEDEIWKQVLVKLNQK